MYNGRYWGFPRLVTQLKFPSSSLAYPAGAEGLTHGVLEIRRGDLQALGPVVVFFSWFSVKLWKGCGTGGSRALKKLWSLKIRAVSVLLVFCVCLLCFSRIFLLGLWTLTCERCA